MTIKHRLFFSLFLVLFLTTPLPYLFSPSQRMTWLVQPRPHSIVQFHTCLLYWHLSEHIFPEHFPSHYSAFPLQQYAVFNLPFVSRFLAWGSEYNNDVRFFLPLAHHLLYFNTCHKVHFGNWSGLKEKESSSSHKHLDNCLLQHEKQLEVSGSWEEEGRWRALWVSGLC